MGSAVDGNGGDEEAEPGRGGHRRRDRNFSTTGRKRGRPAAAGPTGSQRAPKQKPRGADGGPKRTPLHNFDQYKGRDSYEVESILAEQWSSGRFLYQVTSLPDTLPFGKLTALPGY